MTHTGRILSSVLAPALLFASPLFAVIQGDVDKGLSGWSEKIDHVVDVKPGGMLTLETDQGDIEVESWNSDQVRVVIEKSTDANNEAAARKLFAQYPVDISQNGEGVSITAEARGLNSDESLVISTRIYVPRKYSVDVETGGGGISVEDLQGDVTARTGGGGIKVGRIQDGSVDVRTGGGGIRIRKIQGGNGSAVTGGGGIDVGDVTGDLEVRTSGGGISVGEVGGDLIVDTAGGGIGIKDCGGSVTVETGGGGITIADATGPVRAETGGGGIKINDIDGKVVAETGGGGIGIRSAGPIEASTGGGGIDIEDARGYIEASTGGGGIEAELSIADPNIDTHIDLSTGGGDITLVIPGNLQATVDAEIRLDRPKKSYEIESDFDLEIEGGRNADELTATGDINGGGDLIRLRTTNSNIRIERR
ncbi:MAG: hypothetical protein HN712_27295 [Gemmatimonadetes bacterium]|jgi:hypothetical protein|nr:hypothetical protein [Gemmatimonadota bacterium]MBT6145429.1 hypothetical protein [Gemmatimonadota bacterium]MBT7864048.1 hypothetical protein [Gemmatimonadota bacterium]